MTLLKSFRMSLNGTWTQKCTKTSTKQIWTYLRTTTENATKDGCSILSVWVWNYFGQSCQTRLLHVEEDWFAQQSCFTMKRWKSTSYCIEMGRMNGLVVIASTRSQLTQKNIHSNKRWVQFRNPGTLSPREKSNNMGRIVLET